MTLGNDNALDDSDHEFRTPVLRRVIRLGVDGRRRSELNELIDRVLPDCAASADELWTGDGAAALDIDPCSGAAVFPGS